MLRIWNASSGLSGRKSKLIRTNKEVMGRTKRLLSLDTARAAKKTTHPNEFISRCLATTEEYAYTHKTDGRES
jgi:hypothetical protein